MSLFYVHFRASLFSQLKSNSIDYEMPWLLHHLGQSLASSITESTVSQIAVFICFSAWDLSFLVGPHSIDF